MIRLFPLLLSAALLGSAALPRDAAARPPEGELSPARQVEALSQEGARLYREGDYARALERFREALAIQEVGNLHFNIGLCLERLGSRGEAIRHYRIFVAAADVDEGARERAESRLAELGRERPVVAPPPETPPVTRTPPTVDPPVSGTGTSVAGSDTPRRRSRALEWSLIGAGSGLVAVGGALYGVAWAAKGDYEDRSAFSSKRDLRNRAEASALAGDILVGVGAASLVAGVVLLLVLDDSVEEAPAERASPSVLLRPTASPDGGLGLSLEGRF